MATNTRFSEEDITLTSGKGTDEYKKVRANLNSICGTLDLKTGAKTTLRLKFIEKEWLNTTADPSSDQLVMLVLGRIERDSNQYYEFIAMLEDTPGLDLIKKDIKDTNFSQQESHLDQKMNYLHGSDNNPSVQSKRNSKGDTPLGNNSETMTDSGLESKTEKIHALHRSQVKNGTTSQLPKNMKPMPSHELSQTQDSSSTVGLELPTMELVEPPIQPTQTPTNLQLHAVLVTGSGADQQYNDKRISHLEARLATLEEEKKRCEEKLEREVTLYQQEKYVSVKKEMEEQHKELISMMESIKLQLEQICFETKQKRLEAEQERKREHSEILKCIKEMRVKD